jgi:hypothetical protein
MLKRLILSLIMMICLSSCELTKAVIPIETVTPLAPEPSVSPAEMTTTSPGEIVQAPVLALPSKAPLPTIAPEFTDSGCRAGEILAAIRQDFPYEVAGKKPLVASNYFFYQDLRAIVIWFQDTGLNADEPKTDVAKTAALARTHASQVTAELFKRDACLKQLFSVLDIIVVDGADNGWFSGEIVLDEAPTEDDLRAISGAFASVYQRDKAVTPPSATTQCTFSEVRPKIKSHFSDGKQSTANLDFYMVVNEGLATIYAQWTGDNTAANNIARLMNVAIELQCLTSPKIDAILFTVVDKEGQILAAGKMPGESVAKLDVNKIEYQEVK